MVPIHATSLMAAASHTSPSRLSFRFQCDRGRPQRITLPALDRIMSIIHCRAAEDQQQMRLALGMEGASTVYTRAQAALLLYRETARLIEPILRHEDKQVIDTCCTILDQHTIGD